LVVGAGSRVRWQPRRPGAPMIAKKPVIGFGCRECSGNIGWCWQYSKTDFYL
jgi:hypothetical protein